MQESFLNVIKALFSFTKEYGILNKDTFGSLSQNKYILYFIIIQFAQILVFTYSLTQAHTRAYNEVTLKEEIANLKQIIELKYEWDYAVTDDEKINIENKLNELVKDTHALNKELTEEQPDDKIK